MKRDVEAKQDSEKKKKQKPKMKKKTNEKIRNGISGGLLRLAFCNLVR